MLDDGISRKQVYLTKSKGYWENKPTGWSYDDFKESDQICLILVGQYSSNPSKQKIK